MKALPHYYENLKRYLRPESVLESDFKFAKDLGLHLKRLGFKRSNHIIFPDIPISFIAQLDNNLFTTGTGTELESGDFYAMSLDFGIEILNQLKGKIPPQAIDILLHRESGSRKNLKFSDGVFKVTVDCSIGEELQENSEEIFLPFIVNKIVC